MKTRLILLVVLILTLLLAGCAANQSTSSSGTATPVSKPDTDYTLLNMEIGIGAKCTLDVRLPEEINEEEIRHIAQYLLENEGKGCSPLFIFYYLPGDAVAYESAWAYSHFDPDLRVKINYSGN